MSEEENERDFMKACFNVVAGLEVKNENQAIAKEVILDEVKNLTKENNHLKEVIEEVREYVEYYHNEIGKVSEFNIMANPKTLLQILDKAKGER